MELKNGLVTPDKVYKRPKLRGIKSGFGFDGFLSCNSEWDGDFVDKLEETKVAAKPGMTNTQIQREEQLEEIDAAMEDLIDDIEISDEEAPKNAAALPPPNETIPASIAEVLGEPEEPVIEAALAIKSQYAVADLR